ncbi:hypothetical protein RHS04_05544 [Rhizoctonia solani]|uniref:Uncharacterized protein n=1 Tax=Rhizoctonia solani TaxID=456999 RepID=A0A8H7H9U6_9AGAM|nr:hypothetical protein RHS04_05544 [Rhizoctonia solani]
MIDAPNVRFLRFRLQHPTPRNKDIVNYLAKGPDVSNPSPLFPHLIGLDVLFGQSLVQYASSNDLYRLYETVLTAYPSITTLVLLDRAWDDIFELRSWTLPCLERLVVSGGSPLGLKALVSGRRDVGLGPKTLEVLLSVTRSLREPLESYFREAPDGLGVELRFCYSGRRIHEIMGFGG